MKKVFTLMALFSISIVIIAQPISRFSYQSIVRTHDGGLVLSSNIGIQISILQESIEGNAVYVERHFPTTNDNGLVSLEIGNGTVVSGNFTDIDWGDGPYFIKTETDLNGGANYTISGTSQLLSVPYALYAKEVENFDETDPVFNTSIAAGITQNDTAAWNNKPDGFEETDPIFAGSLASNITAQDTTKWASDSDPNNEIQHFSQSGNNVFLTESRSVAVLPDSVIGYTSATTPGFGTTTTLDLATVNFTLDKQRTVLILADVNIWGTGATGCEETIRLSIDGNPVNNTAVHVDIQAAVGGNNGDSAFTSWMTTLAAGSHTVKLRAWAQYCPFHKHAHLHVLVLGN